MRRLAIVLFFISLCFACKQEDRNLLGGEGMLRLTAQVNDEVKIVSRAGEYPEEGTGEGTEEEISPEDELKKNCKIRLYKGDKLVYKHAGWDESLDGEGLALSSGTYRVRITSGDSVAAAFDKKFYEGIQEFEIMQHQTTTVDVVCNIGNTLVKVVFDASLEQYVATGEVTIAVDDSDGALVYPYTQDNSLAKTGYYSLPAGKEYLICTFTGTSKNGMKFTQTDRVEKAKKSTLYTLTYKKGDGETPLPPTDEGGGYLSLKVDETPLAKQEEEITIYQRPQIRAVNKVTGENVDMNVPWYLELNSNIAPEVLVNTSTPLAQVKVESEIFTKMGLPSTEFDLMEEVARTKLQEKGIAVTVQESALSMAWGTSLNTFLLEESEHHIKYTVTDSGLEGESEPKMREIDWILSASDANIMAIEIPYVYQIWADRVTLYGLVIEGRTLPEGSQLFFHYRKQGEQTWSENVPATLADNYIVSEEIKGLTPGTTYEYQILEGEKVSNVTCTFTTEAALQLPNSGFEEWQGEKPMLVYTGDESNMFWDTGNHGSASVSLTAVDLTTKDTSIKVEGSSSAKLKSQFVGLGSLGAFAAGNLFVGDFIKTDGTDGILGWGRSWNVRPLALRGYIRYIPQSCNDERFPDGMDRGIVYIAIGDWAGSSYDNKWPIVIQTKYPETDLFNPNPGTYTGDGIIAYGEKIFQGEVKSADGGMIEFTIPLEYRSMDRMPKSIIVVASASQYGDYFVGGEGSTMWLDALELIYEESKLSKE